MEHGIIDVDNNIDLSTLGVSLEDDVHIELRQGDDESPLSVFLNGVCVDRRIRMLDVSDRVSPISTIPFVRDFVDSILHSFGSNGCVMDGRDIGTVVFPNADLKIYMVSDDTVRAQRRYDEMVARGMDTNFEEVLRNVRERDFIDSHRECHPLRKPEDAVVLDNSRMTIEQQMAWLSGILKERFDIDL